MFDFCRRRIPLLRSALLIAGGLGLAGAKVSAPQFQRHMVLQRDMPIPVWGEADPGERVTISLDGHSRTVTAGSDRKWSASLPALAAGGPHTLILAGLDTLTLEDVRMGDVWVCGGQSNMEFTLEQHDEGLKDSARSGDIPLLRHLNYVKSSLRPGWQDIPWTVSDPRTAKQFSATGYFFGKEVVATQRVAVGLIEVAMGSTEIERWLDSASVAADAHLSRDSTREQPYVPGDLFRKHVRRYLPHRIRGVIWYQGENNIGHFPQHYRDRFQSLIKGWRNAWGQGDFPFLYAQLASSGNALQNAPEGDDKWPVIREAQRLALSQPHTAMSVYLDPADNDIHPNRKDVIGHRLALAARALAYRETGLVHSGPQYHASLVRGATLRLRFFHAGGGLLAPGGSLKGFSLAGTDGKWHWANAEISGDTVVLASPAVPRPLKARYAWASNPLFSLCNREGLQASPFQTEGPQLPAAARAQDARFMRPAASLRGKVPQPRNVLGRRLRAGRT